MPAAGMPEGGPPRLITIGAGISLVVSDVPSSTYNTDALEPRLSDLDWVSLTGAAHHAVVDKIAESGLAVIPFRLFTIFSSEAAAITTLGKLRTAMHDAFERVRNRQEWVLRISKPDLARAASQLEEPARRSSGTTFLQAKADARREAAARSDRVTKEAAAAFAALERVADGVATRAVDPAGTLLLDGAFLVRREKLDEMRETLTAAAAQLLRDGCAVSLTGPWPPYSFASVDPERDD